MSCSYPPSETAAHKPSTYTRALRTGLTEPLLIGFATDDEESDSEAPQGGIDSKGKRKAKPVDSSRHTSSSRTDGDAKRRKGASGATTKPKKARRSKPSHPYVEVEYEEETEGATTESMSFNW